MQYYNKQLTRNALASVVGNRQPIDPQHKLQPHLLQSTIDTYFEDSSPVINSKVIASVMGVYDSPAEHWDASTSYVIGNRVVQLEQTYEALQDNTGVDPQSDPATWEQISDYQLTIEHLRRSASDRLVSDILGKRIGEAQNVKTLLAEAQLFNGALYSNTNEVNMGDFVGIRISVSDFDGLVLRFNYASYQFTGLGTFDFTLYLYTENQEAPVRQQTITVNAPTGRQRETTQLGWVEDYINNAPANAVFYLGYYQEELQNASAQAVRYKHFSSYQSGACCPNTSFAGEWGRWNNGTGGLSAASQFISLSGFSVEVDSIGDYPDFSKFKYNNISNYGLGFHISIMCNATPVVLRNITNWSDAYIKAFAVVLMKAVESTTEYNPVVSAISPQRAVAELSPENPTGAYREYMNALKQAVFDTSGLNSPCLPGVENQGGISYTYGG